MLDPTTLQAWWWSESIASQWCWAWSRTWRWAKSNWTIKDGKPMLFFLWCFLIPKIYLVLFLIQRSTNTIVIHIKIWTYGIAGYVVMHIFYMIWCHYILIARIHQCSLIILGGTNMLFDLVAQKNIPCKCFWCFITCFCLVHLNCHCILQQL